MAINTIINGINTQIQTEKGQQAENQQRQAKPDVVNDSKGSSAMDTVHITDQAQRLQQLHKKVEQLPVVDTQRVDNVRQAIATGNYTVNSDRVAEKMIDFEAQLCTEVESV